MLGSVVGFSVHWCNDKLKFKGVCSQHSKRVVYGDSAEEAMEGIIRVMKGLNFDDEITEVTELAGFEDTDESTNPGWPPFIKLLE